MYFITNRQMVPNKRGFNKFSKHPNEKGPNELTAVEVTGVRKPTVTILKDEVPDSKVKELSDKYSLNLDTDAKHYAPLAIACETFRKARRTKKNILIFVHGYNNDVEDVYATARELEKLYNLIVIPFTWPANGGGALSGSLSYLADKRDARASEDALNRFIDSVGHYYGLLTTAARCQLADTAEKRHPENPTKQRELLSKLLEKECDLNVSLLCHSMGNYVFKHALTSSLAESRKLVFDNVILAAADTNNLEHKLWVESIRARKGVYVLINENDYALSWSRRKPGEEQKARLGHYLRKLDAANAYYINFTGVKGVGSSHSYFNADSANENSSIRRFFRKVFAAEHIITKLKYSSDNNTYRP